MREGEGVGSRRSGKRGGSNCRHRGDSAAANENVK